MARATVWRILSLPEYRLGWLDGVWRHVERPMNDLKPIELTVDALYEAAQSMLTRVKSYSSLKRWAMAVAKRRGMRRAKIALARKLAIVLHRMWISGTEFRFGKEETAAA